MAGAVAQVADPDAGWIQWAHAMLPERFPSGEPIDEILCDLTQTERKVAYLRAVLELSVEETASILDVSRSTIDVHLANIRGKLRRHTWSVA